MEKKPSCILMERYFVNRAYKNSKSFYSPHQRKGLTSIPLNSQLGGHFFVIPKDHPRLSAHYEKTKRLLTLLFRERHAERGKALSSAPVYCMLLPLIHGAHHPLLLFLFSLCQNVAEIPSLTVFPPPRLPDGKI